MDLEAIIQFFDPFMDPSGEAYIQVLPHGVSEAHQIPLDSPTARSLIRAELARALRGRLPTKHERDSCMDVLFAAAYLAERKKAALSFADLVARDPVAQAVLAIHRRGGTKQPPKQLLISLARIARLEGIDITKGKWPPNEDSLGRRLSGFVEPFTKAGIPITRDDTRPRTWTIPPRLFTSDGSGRKVADANTGSQVTSAPDATKSVVLGTPPGDVAAQIAGDEQGADPYTEHGVSPIAGEGLALRQTNGPLHLGPIEGHGSEEVDDLPSDDEIQHLWETSQ